MNFQKINYHNKNDDPKQWMSQQTSETKINVLNNLSNNLEQKLLNTYNLTF